MAGFFLCIEGPEGAGKTTQLARLEKRLQQQGVSTLLTKEPGGTPLGDKIRQLVLLEPDLKICPVSEFLLYASSRAQHVRDVIRPALEEQKVVLCDRFTAASYAYQGCGRGVALDFIAAVNQQATQGTEPQLTLLFDLDPEVGLQRVAARGEKDRLERADLAFHQRVRQGFLQLAKAHPETFVVVDAASPVEQVEAQLWQHLRPRLEAALHLQLAELPQAKGLD